MQENEQLRRELELYRGQADHASLFERMKTLEEEKNALLDYIEENVEKSQVSKEDSKEMRKFVEELKS